MENKQVKQMMIDILSFKFGFCVGSLEHDKADYAFDRLRFYECKGKRIKLRNSHFAKVSLTANQLKGRNYE